MTMALAAVLRPASISQSASVQINARKAAVINEEFASSVAEAEFARCLVAEFEKEGDNGIVMLDKAPCKAPTQLRHLSYY